MQNDNVQCSVPVAVAYRVSHRGLQWRILLLLAADVIKSE